MNATRLTRTRKVLAGGVAGLALTAGLGLGGAGIAEASPGVATCIDGKGVTTISYQGQAKSESVQMYTCVLNTANDKDAGEAGVQVAPRDIAYSNPHVLISGTRSNGTFHVDLQGRTLRGEGFGGGQTPTFSNKVGFDAPLERDGTYKLRDIAVDRNGRTADTFMVFKVIRVQYGK